jgi:hypothetical protein
MTVAAVSAIALLALLSSTGGAATARTPSARVEFGGHTYERFDVILSSWHETEAYCNSLGAHLPTIGSAEENEIVFRVNKTSYLGATDELVEGEWRWVTGEPFAYSNWDVAGGEPNNGDGSGEHYLVYKFPDVSTWNDVYNGPRQSFACEWEGVDHRYRSAERAAGSVDGQGDFVSDGPARGPLIGTGTYHSEGNVTSGQPPDWVTTTTAANGDTITTAFDLWLDASGISCKPGYLPFRAQETVTGGTGQFTDASGQLVREGCIKLAVPGPIKSTSTTRGTINY